MCAVMKTDRRVGSRPGRTGGLLLFASVFASAAFAGGAADAIDLGGCAGGSNAVVVLDLGRAGAGGYPTFDVEAFRPGADGEMPRLRLSYACRASKVGERGDFWKGTAATYLGKDVQLPIFPANPERYEIFRIDRCGTFRSPLLQGLVRYVRLALETPGTGTSSMARATSRTRARRSATRSTGSGRTSTSI